MNSEPLEKINRTVRILLAALAFCLSFSPAAVEVIFGLLCICYAVRALLIRGRVQRALLFFKDKVNLSLLIFYLFLALSIFSSGELAGKSAADLFTKWGQALLLFVFIQIWVRREDLPFYLRIFAVSAVMIILDALYQKTTGTDLIRGFPMVVTNDFTALTGPFHQYNPFGSYLGAALAVLFFERAQAAGLLMKRFWELFIILGLVCLALTYSRGAWFSLASASLIIPGFFGGRKVKVTVFSGVALFTAAVLIHPDLRERFLFFFTSGGDEQRLMTWKASFVMFLDKPWLGHGVGVFMDRVPAYILRYTSMSAEYAYQYAHNCYLQILVEAGIFALLSFFSFWLLAARNAFRHLKESPDPSILTVVTVFFMLSIHAGLDVHFYSSRLSFLFWFFAGISTAGLKKKCFE